METEGIIHVLRLDRPTDPQPWTYDVTFAPSGKGGFLTPRKCLGLPALEEVLTEVGIAGHRRDAALEEVRKNGGSTIPNVRLTENQRRDLWL
jgi:hypothetical protein